MTQTLPQTVELSEEMKSHLRLNACTETYRHLPGEFCKQDDKYGYFIQWDQIKEYQLNDAHKNLEIIRQRIKTRATRKEILNGDIIRYKDGHEERVTYIWDDSVQAGGGSGSYYMGKSGYGSYSGSLNAGLPLNKLHLTDETKSAQFWFFSEDWSGGGRGIYFYCPVKVWQEIY